MSTSNDPLNRERGPLRNGNRRGDPNASPRCGARARTTGCPCRAPAMANGRCRLHGGRSTGPRTPEGMARMIAAKTTHGKYAGASAPRRAEWRYVRAFSARIRLSTTAFDLQAYLPPAMATRLDQCPPELSAPKHSSQVAFEKRQATTAYNKRMAGRGLGRAAGGSRGRAPGAKGRPKTAAPGVAPRVRAAEHAEVLAEKNTQAPWRAAIAFARAAMRAARVGAARGGVALGSAALGGAALGGAALGGAALGGAALGGATLGGAALGGAAWDGATLGGAAWDGATLGGATRREDGPEWGVCINPLQREIALRALGLRAAPPSAATLRGSHMAEQIRRQGLVRSSRPTSAAPARRPLSGAGGDAGNDPVPSLPPRICPGGQRPAARKLIRLAPAEALAPRGTTLACTWVPRIKPIRPAGFRRAAPSGAPVPKAPSGTHVPQASPIGGATMLGGGRVQQYHTT